MSADYFFTVFTPTYNRCGLLPRVYESLQAQSEKSFEWLIVDDGSTDGTQDLVAGWIAKASFPIRYVRQPNGGRHVAHNTAVRLAEGFLFAAIDSDDWYVPAALARLRHQWNTIPDAHKRSFAGVCGLFEYVTGEVVGDRFPEDVLDTDDISLKVRYRVRGDKISAIRLSVMREFPFPEDLGHFVTEAIVWNRVGRRYLTRFFNEVLALKEYQPGGLTDKARVVLAQNPRAARTFHYELLTSGRALPVGMLIRSHANLVRHGLHMGLGWADQFRDSPSKLLLALTALPGWLLYARDLPLLRTEHSGLLTKTSSLGPSDP